MPFSFCRHNVHYKWSMFSFREYATISVVLSFPQKVQYTYHMKYYSWQCASKCKQNSHRFSSTRGTWGKLNSLMRDKQWTEPSLFSTLPYLRDYLDFIVWYMGFPPTLCDGTFLHNCVIRGSTVLCWPKDYFAPPLSESKMFSCMCLCWKARYLLLTFV